MFFHMYLWNEFMFLEFLLKKKNKASERMQKTQQMFLKPKQMKHIVMHPKKINVIKTVGGSKEINARYKIPGPEQCW